MTWATNVLHDQLAQNVPDCAIIPKWIKKAQFNGVFISVIIRTSFPNDEFIYFIRLDRITLGYSVHLCLTVNWVPLHSDISHLFNSEVQLLRYIFFFNHTLSCVSIHPQTTILIGTVPSDIVCGFLLSFTSVVHCSNAISIVQIHNALVPWNFVFAEELNLLIQSLTFLLVLMPNLWRL